MITKREYAAVDVFKITCAFLVMLIHTKPFYNLFWLDAGIGMITRFAVPYFFCVSGFFLFRQANINQENKKSIICKQLVRLIRFYIIWYVIFRLVGLLLGEDNFGLWYNIKQLIFMTNGSPLWFVNALIWAICIVAALAIRLKKRTIFGVSICCLVIGYFLSTLYGITERWTIIQRIQPFITFIGVQNGLFFAFPYVAMGAYLSEIELKRSIKRDASLICIFFLCLGVESLVAVLKLNAPYTFLWLSALPMTYYTVKLTLTVNLRDNPSYYYLRKISTLFYVLHVVVFLTCEKLFVVIGLKSLDSMNLALTCLVLIITTILSSLFVILSRKKQFSWIKLLM